MAPSKILKYSEEDMVKALKAVADGSSFREAARNNGVPKTTLLYKYTGKYPLQRRMGPPTILTTDEEKQLTKWINHCGDNGFPISKRHLIDSVQMLLKDAKRETAFTDNRPGRAWYDRFIDRNNIRERTTQHLNKARSSVTEANIRSWFQEIENCLRATNSTDVLMDPKRVFNMDETAFFMTPTDEKVLVKKGTKVVYSFAHNDEKECITVLLGSNADGILVPPCVVFPYVRLPPRIAQSVPQGWGVGKSESGWMTAELFFEYIANVFHPWLIKQSIQLPIILFVDGHTSHASMPLSDFCSKNGIILVSLYPNATHIYQPMDIGLLHSLKLHWKDKVLHFRMDHNGEKMKKEDFPELLLELLNEINPDILKNSFLASGLYPFNPDAIQYSKLIKDTIANANSLEAGATNIQQVSTNECRKHLEFIEGLIDANTLLEFKDCGDTWNGLLEDTSLFELWFKVFKMTTESSGPQGDIVEGTVVAFCTDQNEIILNKDEDLAAIFTSTDDNEDNFDMTLMDWDLAGEPTEISEPEQTESVHRNLLTIEPSKSSTHENMLTIQASNENKLRIEASMSSPGGINKSPSPTIPTSNSNPFDEKLQKSPLKNNPVENVLMTFQGVKVSKSKPNKQLEEYFEYFREKEYEKEKFEEAKRRRKQIRQEKQNRNKMQNKSFEMLSTPTETDFNKVTQESCLGSSTTTPAVYSAVLEQTLKNCDPTIDDYQNQAHVLSSVQSTTSTPEFKEAENSSDSKNINECQAQTTNLPATQCSAFSSFFEEAHNTSDCTDPKDQVEVPERNIPENVPEIFQKVLFWPIVNKKIKKNQPKERAPSMITLDIWVNHFQQKENAKAKLEQEKLERKKEREDKKKKLEEEKLQRKTVREQKKKSKEFALAVRKLSKNPKTNEQKIFGMNSFVIIKYDNDYMPGVVMEVKEEKSCVSVMVMAGLDQWKWPRLPDIMWYNTTNIVQEISEPQKNERGFFLVPEMSKYL